MFRYGVRVDPEQWLIVLTGRQEGEAEHPSLYLLAYSIVPVIFALVIEKGLAKDILPEKLGVTVQILNLLIIIVTPMISVHIYSNKFSLMGASTVCFIYSVIFLKLWSYVQVNLWCRHARKQDNPGHQRRQSMSAKEGVDSENNIKEDKLPSPPHLVEYPHNLNLSDILYFVCAPTVCYELNFPRTDRIRKRLMEFVPPNKRSDEYFRTVFEEKGLADIVKLHMAQASQEAKKELQEQLEEQISEGASIKDIVADIREIANKHCIPDQELIVLNMDVVKATERLLKLSLVLLISVLCIISCRHLYKPLVEQGYSRLTASSLVFFISAFMHEYLVSVPLRTYKIWAFMGMMGQIPLSMLSRHVEKKYGPRWGNIIVWSSLILGQPLCIMMYYHDFVITHFGEALLDKYSHV
ncbi:diacylglycerol O-acyltransferase 1-like [Diaphorina citri]|uniref:O-acyltransferase n=1 Tax=Diaphorina citri TaxID=121845 RepID=A0A3Q0J3D3_DIACI|nr:diacylglycerol O-acyltransferase 1-like [Diaphorina citri]